MTEPNDNTRTPPKSAYAALKYDPEKFRGHVNDMGLSLSQQDALLEDIWLIVIGVIDAAFGSRPFSAPAKTLAVDSGSVLRSIINLNEQKQKTAKAEEA